MNYEGLLLPTGKSNAFTFSVAAGLLLGAAGLWSGSALARVQSLILVFDLIKSSVLIEWRLRCAKMSSSRSVLSESRMEPLCDFTEGLLVFATAIFLLPVIFEWWPQNQPISAFWVLTTSVASFLWTTRSTASEWQGVLVTLRGGKAFAFTEKALELVAALIVTLLPNLTLLDATLAFGATLAAGHRVWPGFCVAVAAILEFSPLCHFIRHRCSEVGARLEVHMWSREYPCPPCLELCVRRCCS